MGRPLKPIDAEQVEKLAKLGCTVDEIADFFGCSKVTVYARFSEQLTRGRASEKMSIRRARTIRAIKDRSDAMLIYLSKVRLGENEKQPQGNLDPSSATDEHGNSIDP
jgi:AraC-like DNA-binding protein